MDADVSDNAKPLLGLGCPLCELAGRMRKAAADLEFEEAARLRDAIKRLKMLDPEFANEALTPEGKQLDRNASKLARAGAAEWYRRGDGESAACRSESHFYSWDEAAAKGVEVARPREPDPNSRRPYRCDPSPRTATVCCIWRITCSP